jgi:transposase
MAKLKLTPELIEKLIPSIEAGNYVETVCQAHGISRNTYYLWLKKGESAKAKTIYRYFYDMVKDAEARAEQKLIEEWRDKLKESPTNYKDFLERRYPERWGKKETVKVEGGEKPLKVQNENITEKIISDPIAIELAFQLRERLRMGEDEPVGTGGAGESGKMDSSKTP